MERGLIAQFEEDMGRAFAILNDDNLPLVKALAELPMDIRGFGPVKAENVAKAGKKRENLLQRLFGAGGQVQAAE
ncbi:hypothetical protein CGU36_28140, partial [Pseudomonas fluorescens]